MTDGRRTPASDGVEIPPGYVTVSVERDTWMTRSDCAAALPSIGAGSVLGGSAGRAFAPGGGRAGLMRLRIGPIPAVAKRARHGGMVRFLGGLYLGRRRAVLPLLAALRLHESGVPTPCVLAAGWRRLLGPIHAHALVTEAIPGGVNLQTALEGGMSPAARRAALAAAGTSVRAMHDAGFLHADLNLANLVLEPGPAGPRAHIVDLDRGRFAIRLSPARRRSNLVRLLRSWEKWRPGGRPPGLRDAVTFLRAYSHGERNAIRCWVEDLTRSRRRLGLRRAVWRLTGKPGGRPSSGIHE